MKRVLNTIIFLVLVGAVLFVGFKARLIPNPFDRKPAPDVSPTPNLVERDTLRVAVAKRPEKLLMASLQRLLQVDGHKLELVEYNPQNVWLELAAGEIDLVIAPLGEAVKAQGRFQAGRFLMFTGESVGLDQVLAWPESQDVQRVAVQTDAGTDFLARQLLPEATVVQAADAQELEAWLKGKAVEAALVDTSSNTPGLEESFKLLAATSPEKPIPSVAVLSKVFAQNADKPQYTARRDILAAALRSWNGLVSYLDSQPELLVSTLKTEASEMGVDIDRLLKGYRFLTPGQGRAGLVDFQNQDKLKQTLDLLVLSGVTNLSGPDWEVTVEAPAFLSPSWSLGVSEAPPLTATPTPATTPTPVASATPASTPNPETSQTPSQTAPDSARAATYSHPDLAIPTSWPAPVSSFKTRGSGLLAPALSSKAVAALTSNYLFVNSFGNGKPARIELDSEPTSGPVSDGTNFFYPVRDAIVAVNSQGKQLWKVGIKGTPLSCTQVVAGRLLYALETDDGGRVLCLDTVDGEILWEQTLSSPPASGPVVGNLDQGYAVVVLEQSGQANAFSVASGSSLWTHTLDDPSYIGPAAGYGKLAVVYPNGEVVLLSLQEGKRIWEVSLGSSQAAPPTVTSQGVLVPSKDTYLYLLSLESGDITWKTRLSHSLSEPAIELQHKVFQSDENGQIHVLKKLDGSLLDTLKIGNGWVSRVVPSERQWAITDSSGTCRVYQAP